MIYDCFTFFNEMDLLEIRLNALDGVVDRFVAVEANMTYSGQPKEPYLANGLGRFARFRDKLRVFCADMTGIPPSASAWTREHFQRNFIGEALRRAGDVAPDDVIMLSDLDEIPDPAKVKPAADICLQKGVSVRFRQSMRYYYLDCLNVTEPVWGDIGTVMARYRDIDGFENLRQSKAGFAIDGGWHFSYLGGADMIRMKLKSFAHQEFNEERYTDVQNIARRVAAGEDILGRRYEYKKCAVDDLPAYVKDNAKKYKNFFMPAGDSGK